MGLSDEIKERLRRAKVDARVKLDVYREGQREKAVDARVWRQQQKEAYQQAHREATLRAIGVKARQDVTQKGVGNPILRDFGFPFTQSKTKSKRRIKGFLEW